MSESDVPTACAPYDEDLSAWLDGELAEREAAALRAHLEGCARCAARADELRAVDRALRELAAAAPSAREAVRLARLRARLAEARAGEEAQDVRDGEASVVRAPLGRAGAPRAPLRAADSDETAVRDSAAVVPQQAPRPARRSAWRRRVPAALLGAAAAVALAIAVVPPLLERALSTTEDELVLAAREAPARDEEHRAPAPESTAPPPQSLPAPGAEDARVAQRTPPTAGSAGFVPEREPTPGHLGASAAPDAASAPAARSDAALDAERAEEAGPAPDELADVAPEDLALVERLDAIERLPHAIAAAPAEGVQQGDAAHRIASLPPAERARVRANLARWRAMTPAERDEARARWQRFQELPGAEQERLLRSGE